MTDIISILKSIGDDLMTLGGVTEADIMEAEEQLTTSFSEEYKKYLQTFGIASWDGVELTGICKSKHQNVVDVTLRNRADDVSSRNDLYVIEELGIDGIVIWQNQKGEVYQTVNKEKPVKVADSMAEYIKQSNIQEENAC